MIRLVIEVVWKLLACKERFFGEMAVEKTKVLVINKQKVLLNS
jgi:hypothetical protein